MTNRETAQTPEDITRLFVDRANAGDVEGLAELYEPDAVMAFPPGELTVGLDAIRAVMQGMIDHGPGEFPHEELLPTLRLGDIALTATKPEDGTGGRAQVVRRQADVSWLRILDRPEAGGS
jgi:ketosteroid isomerase-like protein